MPPAKNRVEERQCPGCGGWFRIASRRGRSLPAAVPCPACDTRIPVERPSSERFWVSKSHGEIFRRRRAAEGDHSAGSDREGPGGDGVADRRRGGVGRIDRAFRDVSEFRRDGESTLPDRDREPKSATAGAEESTPSEFPSNYPSDQGASSREERREREPESTGAAGSSPEQKGRTEDSETERPFDEYEREPPRADLDGLEEELELVAAEAVDGSEGTPLPLPIEESDVSSEDATDVDVESTREDREPPSQATDQGEEVDPTPAAELATVPFAEWERQWSGDVDASIYDVRVRDTVHEQVSIRDVVDLLEEGIWAGAVDVRDERGEWVALPNHPAFETLRSHLVDQSQQILLRRGQDVEPSAEFEPPDEGGALDSALEPGEGGDEEGEAVESDTPPPVPEELESGGEKSEPTSASKEVLEGSEVSESDASAPQPSGGGRRRLIALAFAGAWIVVTVAAALFLLQRRNGSAGGESAESVAALGKDVAPDGEPVEEDAGRANADRRRSARPAVTAARSAIDEALSPKKLARGYLDGGALGAARRLAVRAMVRRGVGRELRSIFIESIRRDKSLVPKPVTIGDGVDVDAIHALGGGWSLSFRMTRDGESAYAFKPAQKNWERGWRAEIAAYHLCEVVTCHFEIPRNRPARIRKSRFLRLYGRVGGEGQRDYRERFDELVWRTEEGPDGEMHPYLYGTLKDWVPDFVKWPIEYETVWQPWLSGDTSPEILDRPLEQALAPLKKKGKEDFYESILEEKGGATTRSVSKQLSSILVFDFLTTNWDRFSTAEKYYGVNNQFANGRFISLDNGAAFSPHHFRVVTRRLAPVTRYSASTIASIRALEPSVVNPILFPNPTMAERRRLAVFWEQRDKLLDRVNGLIVEHGRETVFSFD